MDEQEKDPRIKYLAGQLMLFFGLAAFVCFFAGMWVYTLSFFDTGVLCIILMLFFYSMYKDD